jgi:hypothetical protein
MMDAKKYPFPPPCAYPLAPRPRPARVLHSWAEQAHPLDDPEAQAQHLDVLPQAMIGPPYSCLVVERPDSQNAFSYGFGPNGAGGIVVYTGFLDQVLNHPRTPQNVEPTPLPSWWSMIFGSLISSPRRQQAFTPSEEQTAELAVLLAHELAHLLLSHHLETLSSGTILYPSVMSIFTDVARTILFPITMLLGPFVNDALGQMGRKHSARFERLGEMCSARKLEIEAGAFYVILSHVPKYLTIKMQTSFQPVFSHSQESTRAKRSGSGSIASKLIRSASLVQMDKPSNVRYQARLKKAHRGRWGMKFTLSMRSE